jgi:hypothetical protein
MTIKADVTQVQIGFLSIEGLMSENGDFGVAVPQLASIDFVPPNRSVKQLKALLGEAFPSHEIQKWKTALNSKEVNVIPLEQFQSLVRVLDKRGNPAASKFVDAMLGLSLHQLFADAFGIKFEQEERQQWLITRMATKHDFRPLTDMLKRYGFTEKREYARFMGAFQTKLGIESGTRDSISIDKLVALQGAQVKLTTLMECGFNPWQALSKI